jgi:hypothetical protein
VTRNVHIEQVSKKYLAPSITETNGHLALTLTRRSTQQRTLSFVPLYHRLTESKWYPQTVVLYRAFVGKGNNSILVKTAIKNRFWWNIVAEKTKNDEVNFVWLQQRDN